MIDTDKYGMTNEKLLDTYSNLSVDGYKDLLAEVLRLREVERTLMRLVTPYVSTAQIEKALKELIE
tara:strand:+ start:288 stop:485 length:198 start_codon:yes stop_codon:yes gene_type:complete